jgi:uncharacterized membrane protein
VENSRTGQPKTWREDLSSRLTASNAIYFLGGFAFCFVAFRTAFFHAYDHSMPTKTAAITASLLALFWVMFRRK